MCSSPKIPATPPAPPPLAPVAVPTIKQTSQDQLVMGADNTLMRKRTGLSSLKIAKVGG